MINNLKYWRVWVAYLHSRPYYLPVVTENAMYNFQSKQDLLFQYRSGLSGEYGAEPQIIVNTRTACVHPRAEVVCSKLSVITGRVSLRFCTVHRKKKQCFWKFPQEIGLEIKVTPWTIWIGSKATEINGRSWGSGVPYVQQTKGLCITFTFLREQKPPRGVQEICVFICFCICLCWNLSVIINILLSWVSKYQSVLSCFCLMTASK